MGTGRKRVIIFISLFLLSMVLIFTGCGKKKEIRNIKAGFIYSGPVGNFGWSWAHNEGRKAAAAKYSWLTTVFAESIPVGEAPGIIDRFIREEKCDVVIMTGPQYGELTLETSGKYPNTIFMQCGGTKQRANLGTYQIDLYQIYYLNGIMAGGLTKSDMIGYVASFPVPEVIRCINSFALGIRAVNPDAKVHVRWINALYAPDKAREAGEALISLGIDTLAYTEDTPAIVELGQAFTVKGKQVYTFSHYSPLKIYGGESVVSGQLANWGAVYEKIFSDIQDNKWKKTDKRFLAADNAALLGAQAGELVNLKFSGELKQLSTATSDSAKISLYDFFMKRYEQMVKQPPQFDPFNGPIYDNKGNERIAEGKNASDEELNNMMYFVDNIQGTVP